MIPKPLCKRYEIAPKQYLGVNSRINVKARFFDPETGNRFASRNRASDKRRFEAQNGKELLEGNLRLFTLIRREAHQADFTM